VAQVAARARDLPPGRWILGGGWNQNVWPEPVLPTAADLDAVEFRDPAFPVVTNVDARMVRTGAEARDALKRQVSRPVLWSKSMDLLSGEAIDTFVEFGPGKVLSGLIKRIGKGWPHPFSIFNVEDVESLERTRAGLT